jgi:uncharacterized protein (DUF2345 family)
MKLDQAIGAKALIVMLSSQVKSLTDKSVVIACGGEEITMPNDVTIVCAGGELPTKLLQAIGVTVESHFGGVRSA